MLCAAVPCYVMCDLLQDFLSVLGSHFRDVAATWQHFLLSQVAPMADCDPGMVSRGVGARLLF